MASTTYMDLLDAVKAYYGSGSDEWVEIAKYGFTSEQSYDILRQVPGVSIDRAPSGRILGYDYVNPFKASNNPVSVIDSNIPNSELGSNAFSSNVPSSAEINQTTGKVVMTSGPKKVATGTTLTSVADKVSLGIAGVALGTKLGKLIDSTIYSLDPQWWDTHFPTINPETWDDMAVTTGGKSLIRAIFGLENDDNNMTAYMDERLLAYTYMTLLANGAYSSGGVDIESKSVGDSVDGATLVGSPMPMAVALGYDGRNATWNAWINATPYGFYFADSDYMYLYTSRTPLTTHVRNVVSISGSVATLDGSLIDGGDAYTIFGKSFSTGVFGQIGGARPLNRNQIFIRHPDIYTKYLFVPKTVTALDGVNDNPNASMHIDPSTVINPTTQQPVTPNDNVDDVLQALKNAYPDLFEDAVKESVPQPDGTIKETIYIPVPYPDFEDDNDDEPVSDDDPTVDPQTDPEIDPENRPQSLIDKLIELLTTPITPPDTGTGDGPTVIPPTGNASSLWKVYNPTQAQVDAFGAWLWNSDLVEQIKKLFNDPMQAIIGIHKVFATPIVGGTSTIKCGYIDSQVPSNYISSQYSYVNCGAVNLREYFGNVFDYSPYTKVHLYLPFIGIVELDVSDVMRGSVSIKYSVDVITGACLAEVTVTRDGAGGVIYSYSGSAIVTYPLSSGSYASAIGGVLSIAAGVVGTIASGGALAPMALGAAAGVSHLHSDVKKSGGFSGCAGAMGIKKPYFIISRPQTAMANNFQHFVGLPANSYVTLGDCSGHVRVGSVHVENIHRAADDEKKVIETLLKQGVII